MFYFLFKHNSYKISSILQESKMKVLICIVILLFFIGCGNNSSQNEPMRTFDSKVAPYSSGKWYKPDIYVSWQWQLKESVNSSYDVDIYDIDLFDADKSLIQSLHDEGKKVICYFSAGSYENWRDDKDDFPLNAIGKTMDGWSNEKWLDISNKKLAPVMSARLDLAVEKGCDGVEPDNVDGYSNDTGFSLSADDQLAYNKFIANQARERGLSVGLKNSSAQAVALEPYFDFSISEQCYMFDECDSYLPFINANKPVLNVEYKQEYIDNDNNERDNMCSNLLNLKFKILVLPLDLDDSFRYSCD